MKSESSEFEILFIVISLGVVIFIATTFTTTFINPSMSKSYASVANLAAKINEVCERGGSTEVNVALPQNIVDAELDLKVTKISIGKGVFPRAAMISSGDPNVLLYYESFPPGEAVSWELHNDFDRRVVAYYRNADSGTVDCSGEERCILKQTENIISSRGYDYTVFGNLLLKNWQKNGINFVGDVGEWNEDKSAYRFTHYDNIGNLNKTAIKYRTCGVNALCMKTRDSVLVFPLDKCEAAGIDYVQLSTQQQMFQGTEAGTKGAIALVNVALKVKWLFGKLAWANKFSPRLIESARILQDKVPGIFNDAKSATKISLYTAAGASVEDTSLVQKIEDVATLADGNTDFYLASPCEAQLVVEKTQCTCWDDFPNILGFQKLSDYGAYIQHWELQGGGSDYIVKKDANDGFRCRNRIDAEGLSRRELEDTNTFENYLQTTDLENERECVKITVKEHNGFCFSKFKGVEGSSEYPLYQSAFLQSPVFSDVVALESSDTFPRPDGIFESDLASSAYTWP